MTFGAGLAVKNRTQTISHTLLFHEVVFSGIEFSKLTRGEIWKWISEENWIIRRHLPCQRHGKAECNYPDNYFELHRALPLDGDACCAVANPMPREIVCD